MYISLITPWESWLPLPDDIGFGHMTCSSQWIVSSSDAGQVWADILRPAAWVHLLLFSLYHENDMCQIRAAPSAWDPEGRRHATGLKLTHSQHATWTRNECLLLWATDAWGSILAPWHPPSQRWRPSLMSNPFHLESLWLPLLPLAGGNSLLL